MSRRCPWCRCVPDGPVLCGAGSRLLSFVVVSVVVFVVVLVPSGQSWLGAVSSDPWGLGHGVIRTQLVLHYKIIVR